MSVLVPRLPRAAGCSAHRFSVSRWPLAATASTSARRFSRPNSTLQPFPFFPSPPSLSSRPSPVVPHTPCSLRRYPRPAPARPTEPVSAQGSPGEGSAHPTPALWVPPYVEAVPFIIFIPAFANTFTRAAIPPPFSPGCSGGRLASSLLRLRSSVAAQLEIAPAIYFGCPRVRPRQKRLSFSRFSIIFSRAYCAP